LSATETNWLTELQRLQDLLARAHRICFVTLDAEGNELTIPSGLPALCAHQLASRDPACLALITATIARSRRSGQAATSRCPSGRTFCVTPVGSAEQNEHGGLFVLAGRVPELDPDLVTLIEQVFRLANPPPGVALLAGRLGTAARDCRCGPATLTKREWEVLSLMGAGLSNRQIASRLYISEATVKTHITHILQKLGVSNRTEAALYAMREGATAGWRGASK
jgi:DNA-binding CsgD family transcriptional regulator/ligand-binding sensor protein